MCCFFVYRCLSHVRLAGCIFHCLHLHLLRICIPPRALQMHDQTGLLISVPAGNIRITTTWGPNGNDLGVNELLTDRKRSSLHLNWNDTPACALPLTCVNLKRTSQPISTISICFSPKNTTAFSWSSLKCFSIYSIIECGPIFNQNFFTVMFLAKLMHFMGCVQQLAQQLQVII